MKNIRICFGICILIVSLLFASCRADTEQNNSGADGDLLSDGDVDKIEADEFDSEFEFQETEQNENETEEEIILSACRVKGGKCISGSEKCAAGYYPSSINLECDSETPLCCLSGSGVECQSNEDCHKEVEQCLPDGWKSELKHCRPFCNALGGSCPNGYACYDGTCEEIEGFCTSDTDCGEFELCNKIMWSYGNCVVACIKEGYKCAEYSICDDDENSPTYGRCISNGSPDDGCVPCETEDECAYNQYCDTPFSLDLCLPSDGCCRDICYEDDDCTNDLICLDDGRCGKVSTNCGGNGCPYGYICDPRYDMCKLNCPECGPGECCDAESAPHCYMCECVNPAVCGLFMPRCCYGSCCSSYIYGVQGFCI